MMLQAAELTIRRMEYRIAQTSVSVIPHLKTLPMASELGGQFTEDGSKDELQRLAGSVEELVQQLAEQTQRFAEQVDSARKEGFEAGRNAESALHASAIDRIASAIRSSLEDFCSTRDNYFAQVEREVVRLALSIAARILHRETQMDPLLLSGAVRVALGQLSETTEARLRVPEPEFELWKEMVQLMPNLPLRPHLISDSSLCVGECLLETNLGSVELGVKAQLTEVEQGFFDLLEHRGPVRRNRDEIVLAERAPKL